MIAIILFQECLMKRSVCFSAAIFLALYVGACASNTAQEDAVPEDAAGAFEMVYNTYRPDLILDGADTYTVVKGDTLSAITKRHYGAINGYFFPLIMLASSDVVLDPDLIEPDMSLTIPDLQRNLDDINAREKIKSFLTDIAGVYEQKAAPITQRRLLELAASL
jgi:hypothetical protein